MEIKFGVTLTLAVIASVGDKQVYVVLNFHNSVVFLSSFHEIMIPIKTWTESLARTAIEKYNLRQKNIY